MTAAQAASDPLDEQGLRLADGTLADRPASPVWGSAAARGIDPAAQRRLATLRRELGSAALAWDDPRQALSGAMVRGVDAPGAVSSAATAEASARAWLALHLSAFAPGSTLADFVLVSNVSSSGIRSLGFAQHHRGVPVLGGQIAVHFKADRLAFVSATALPFVDVEPTGATVADHTARHHAVAWIDADYPALAARADAVGGRAVLPVWDGRRWHHHDVVEVDVVATTGLGRWTVYVDATSGAPVARRQQMSTAVQVRFNVPQRHPNSTRVDLPAPLLFVAEGGNPATTNASGAVELTTSPSNVITTVGGPLVQVQNSPAAEATFDFAVTDGDTITWTAPDEFTDAQLTTFIHTGIVKEFVRTLDPGLAWLDQTITATVNLMGSCNASSDGDSIYFLQASGDCQNTGRLADVIYHEVGHSVHRQSLIPAVGSFDGALSEGISDYLAATIVDDSGMGRGFTYDDEPLRELDPEGSEWTWPDDIGEVHATGRIIGGTLWDLRALLMGTLGEDTGRSHVDQLYYEATRRAHDIPSMYPQALLFDDDDGDLANGTPNGCDITAVFQAHGLVDPGQLGTTELLESQGADGREIILRQEIVVLPECGSELASADLRWRLRGDPPGEFTEAAMTLDGGDFVGLIPYQDTGTVAEYQVTLTYSNGFSSTMPQNAADPWAQTFFGDTQPIYCLDDAADLGEWTLEGTGNNWGFGPLDPSTVDPEGPYDDDGVLLTQNGEYPPSSNTRAISPTIDISGREDVRLHMYRWLTVEDGAFDRATLYANFDVQWQNLATEIASVHHIDRQWRFVDIDLSQYIEDGDLRFGFELTSDQGLHLGGWNIDAMCVVEVTDAVCGDGQVGGSEQCDDGNTEDGDGCDAQCRDEDEPGGTTGGPSDSGGEESGGIDETGTEPPGGTAGVDTVTTSDTATGGDETDGAAAGDGGGCGCTTKPRSGSLGWLLMLTVLGLRRRLRLRLR